MKHKNYYDKCAGCVHYKKRKTCFLLTCDHYYCKYFIQKKQDFKYRGKQTDINHYIL